MPALWVKKVYLQKSTFKTKLIHMAPDYTLRECALKVIMLINTLI